MKPERPCLCRLTLLLLEGLESGQTNRGSHEDTAELEDPAVDPLRCVSRRDGGTALLLVWSAQEELPYYPTIPIIAALGVALVALLERYLPFHESWLRDHGDTASDVVHAAVNLSVLFAVHFLISAAPKLAVHPLWPTDWPVWTQSVLAGVVLDLSLFAMHLLSHRVQWLWRFHAIHHSSERLYWLNGEDVTRSTPP